MPAAAYTFAYGMLFCTGSHGGGQMAKQRRGNSWAFHVIWTMTVRSAWRVVPWAGAVSASCHKLRRHAAAQGCAATNAAAFERGASHLPVLKAPRELVLCVEQLLAANPAGHTARQAPKNLQKFAGTGRARRARHASPQRQQPRPVTVVDASELRTGWQPLRLQHFAIEKVLPHPQEPTPLDDADAGAVEVITLQDLQVCVRLHATPQHKVAPQ